ncbi:MAG TPA: hypothetical protein VNK96_08465 [Fimbriimonadales bacterium]|nr:hypothetical protein [Fimbriimonadales bacterium]
MLAEIDFDGNLVFSYRWEMDAGLWSKGLETVTEIATSLTGSISTLEFKLREKQSINISDWDDSSVITKVKEKILSSLLFRADSVEAKSSPFRLVELALESNIPSTGLSEVYYTNAKDGIALYEEFTMSNILRNSVDIEPFAFREQAYRFARESLGFEDIGISRRDWGDSDWQYPSAHMSDISDVSDMSDMSGMSGMSGISPQ